MVFVSHLERFDKKITCFMLEILEIAYSQGTYDITIYFHILAKSVYNFLQIDLLHIQNNILTVHVLYKNVKKLRFISFFL